MSCNICATEIPLHEEIACRSDHRKGGIPAYAILLCGHTITDFTNAGQWNTNISSGKVRLSKNIDGNVPKASPVQGANPNGCGLKQVTDTYDRTFLVLDYNVTPDNNEFYDAVNEQSVEGIAWLNCAADEINVVAVPAGGVLTEATPVIPNDDSLMQFYDVTFKWRSLPMPTIYNAPPGIFTQ